MNTAVMAGGGHRDRGHIPGLFLTPSLEGLENQHKVFEFDLVLGSELV